MKTLSTSLHGVHVFEPVIFADDRGLFYESFNHRTFSRLTEIECHFVQDNHSESAGGVLRGLHYQIRHPQGKLIRVVHGEIFDVALDIRKSSPTFGQWSGEYLSAMNHREVWVPEGFAHGFVVTSDHAVVLYSTTDYWMPEHERCIIWNDPASGIEWPLRQQPKLSERDRNGVLLAEAETFE